MANSQRKFTVVFVNPNTKKEFSKYFEKIILEKILALQKDLPRAMHQPVHNP